jgi:hypothetical protein
LQAVINLALFGVAWGLREAADQGDLAKLDVATIVQDEEGSSSYEPNVSEADYRIEDDDYHVHGRQNLPSSSKSDSLSNPLHFSQDVQPPRFGLSFDSSSGSMRGNNVTLEPGRSASTSAPGGGRRSVSFSLDRNGLFRQDSSDIDENALAVRTMSVS